MNYSNIINGFNNALRSIPNVPALFTENQQGKPSDVLTPWMRSTMIPSEPIPVTIGYYRQFRFTSVFQIDYFSPLDGGSDIEVIDTIINWFNSADNRFRTEDGTEFIVTAAWRQTAEPMTAWYRTPIMVRVQWYGVAGN